MFVGNSGPMKAAELAATAAGTIRGQPVDLRLIPDDGGSGALGITTAERIAADPRVVAVVGHASSATSVAAAQTYNAAGIPQIAPTASAETYSLAGPYSFRLLPSDASQARFLARQPPAGARIGIIYMNGDYGRGLSRALRHRLDERRLEPVLEMAFTVPFDTVEKEAITNEVAATRPDYLFWIGTPDPLARLVPSIRRSLPTVTIYGSDAMDSNDTYSEFRDRLVGVRFVRFVDPQSTDPRVRAVRMALRQATGRELTYDVVFAYDAVALLARAIRDGARSREDIRAYLLSLGRSRPAFPGVGGPIAFDAARDALRPYLLAEVNRSGVRPLQAR